MSPQVGLDRDSSPQDAMWNITHSIHNSSHHLGANSTMDGNQEIFNPKTGVSSTFEKPYTCSFCPYSAATKGDLTVHLRRHTGERPYKCSFCSYTATQSSTLRAHVRGHTGEKPFVCPYCPYRAASNSTLTKHLTKHKGKFINY